MPTRKPQQGSTSWKIVIPAEICEQIDIKNVSEIQFEMQANGTILLTPIKKLKR
jgi:antitoxin component of MazEF toxin-antitoxin module